MTAVAMWHGPMLAQEKVTIAPRATGASLTRTLADLGAQLLVKTLPRYLAGSLQPHPQDHSKATVTNILTREDGAIDWKKSVEEIDRQVRAYHPWPGTYSCWQGKRLKILEAQPATQAQTGSPGKVTAHDDKMFVLTGKGTLQLENVQLEGSKPQSALDFLRGHSAINGSTLEQC